MSSLPHSVESEIPPVWPSPEHHHKNAREPPTDGSSATVPRTPDRAEHRSIGEPLKFSPSFQMQPIPSRPTKRPLERSAPDTPNSFVSQYPGLFQQLLAGPAKRRWQWSDVDDRERALALGHLEISASQLAIGLLSTVPDIPETYLFDFEQDVCCFRPNNILLLRHLNRNGRHEQYTEFIRLGCMMRDTGFGNELYWDAWSLMVETTERLRKQELKFYLQFAEQPGLTAEQINARANDWMKVTADQAKAYNIDYPTDTVRVTDKKRPRSEEDEAQCPSNPKKAKVEFTATALKEKLPLPELIFETPARDQMLLHKTGEATADRPQYIAEHAWAETGAWSKYPWMAWADEVELKVQAKDALLYPDDNGLRPLSDEQNKNLPIWKQCYQSDLVSLPQYPEQDPNAYSRHADGSFRCLHTDYSCVDGTCSQKNHECCKTGYKTVSHLKTAIRRAVRTWKSQVEVMVDNKKLDERHKSWTGWCNPRLSKQKKKKAEETKSEGEKTAAEELSDDTPYTVPATFEPAAIVTPDALTHEELADQEQRRQQELAATLRRQNFKESKARKTYQKTRMFPDWNLFNAWWTAVRREQCGEFLSDEDKKLRQQPNPQYVPDVPLVVEESRDDQSGEVAGPGILNQLDGEGTESGEAATEDEILRALFE